MSIKDDINLVRNELNSEEKFLESFIKLERFYKKHKMIILGIIGIVVILIISYLSIKYTQNENKIQANIAFNKLLESPKDLEAIKVLKESNQKLYEVFKYLKLKENNKNSDINLKYLKEFLSYEKALSSKNVNALNQISMQNNFLLKEFAIFNKALILTDQQKFNDARLALKLIPKISKVNDLAKVLNHYLLSK